MGLKPTSRLYVPTAAIFVFATVYFMPPGMLRGFCVRLMGVHAFVLRHRLQRPVQRIWIVDVCALLFLAIAYDKSDRIRTTIGIDTEYVIGVAFSILVVCVTHLDA